MEFQFRCLPCFLSQALDALENADANGAVTEAVMKSALNKLANFDQFSHPLAAGFEVHRIVRDQLGSSDPYQWHKQTSNEKALELIPEIKQRVVEGSNSLEVAVRTAIAGNIIDFGPRGEFDIEQTLERCLREEFAVKDFSAFEGKLSDADSLLYFADNAGEIVFDGLLMETLFRQKQLDTISLVVKGGPFLNDATVSDALEVGLDDIDNLRLYEISNGEPESGPDYTSGEVQSWIEEHDLVIAKGQANYEGLSQYRYPNLFFLLVVKCSVIGEIIGVPTGKMVLQEATQR